MRAESDQLIVVTDFTPDWVYLEWGDPQFFDQLFAVLTIALGAPTA